MAFWVWQDGVGWVSLSSLPPSGAAGGDLTGTYPNPTVHDVSILTTKGDLLVRGGSAPAARLAVGSDTQVLTADSTQTNGVKWAASAGGPPSGAAGGDLAGTYPNPTVGDVSILTTKGDLLVRGGSAPAARLPVGSNNQVLTADSTQTDGVKWATPAGVGTWADFTPSTTGITGATVNNARWIQVGKIVFVQYDVQGTSNATTKTFTLPITIQTTAGHQVEELCGLTQDNGSVLTSPGRLHAVPATPTTATLFKDAAGAAWTNSGAWRVGIFFFYETT